MYNLILIFILFTFTQEQKYSYSSKDSEENLIYTLRGNIFLLSHSKNIHCTYKIKIWSKFVSTDVTFDSFLCLFHKQKPDELILGSIQLILSAAPLPVGIRRHFLSGFWLECCHGFMRILHSWGQNSPWLVKSKFLLRIPPRPGRFSPTSLGSFRSPSGFLGAAPVSVTTQWGWGWTCCIDLIGWHKRRGFPTTAAAGSPF